MNLTGRKFAHDVVYSGSEQQIIKFAEALIAAGYKIPEDNPIEEQSEGNSSVSTFGVIGVFDFHHTPIVFADDVVFPSDQFAEALAAATKPAE